jgi:hypothetical protein
MQVRTSKPRGVSRICCENTANSSCFISLFAHCVCTFDVFFMNLYLTCSLNQHVQGDLGFQVSRRVQGGWETTARARARVPIIDFALRFTFACFFLPITMRAYCVHLARVLYVSPSVCLFISLFLSTSLSSASIYLYHVLFSLFLFSASSSISIYFSSLLCFCSVLPCLPHTAPYYEQAEGASGSCCELSEEVEADELWRGDQREM